MSVKLKVIYLNQLIPQILYPVFIYKLALVVYKFMTH